MEKLIKNFEKLTYAQQSELLESLKQTLSKSKPILQHKKLSKECIYCGSTHVYKHGTYKNGGTRYRCQNAECMKSFNELSGTAIHAINKKDLWDRFIGLTLESKTLREIAAELNIHVGTAFAWRHKAMEAFEKTFTKEFKGIVESDDVYINFNQKGRRKNLKRIYGGRRGASDYQVSVMFTLDRYKTYDFKKIKVGAVNSAILGEKMKDTLSRLNKENIICTDGSRALEKFMKSTDLVHKQVDTDRTKPIDKDFNLKTLDGTASMYKNWVKGRFKNVATKYLEHYLNYWTMLQILGNEKSKEIFWDYMLVDSEAFKRSKEVESEYQEFLKIA